MNEFAISNLLSQVNAISQKHALLAKETGGNFNIFKITDIADKEVLMCRVLYELLSPKGSHNQGTLYLSLFVKNVLRIDADDRILDNAVVEREKIIENDRRIDLFVQFGSYKIPIEVKIYAGEQKNQCEDYLKYAETSSEAPVMYYLTLDGSMPSKYSTVQADRIKPISWASDILGWIEASIAEPQTIKLAPIREVLQQFANTVRMLTNQTERGEKMEIKKAIMSSPATMKSAEKVAKLFDNCKAEMMLKLFQAIETRLDKKSECDYKTECENYYNYRNSIIPPKQRYAIGNGRYIKIFIVHRLNVGLDTTDSMGNIVEHDKEGGTKLRAYLPQGGKEINDNSDCPNFHDCNEAFYKLFDDDYFEVFVEDCVLKIEDLWKDWETRDFKI